MAILLTRACVVSTRVFWVTVVLSESEREIDNYIQNDFIVRGQHIQVVLRWNVCS
ncbi:hypothetical protein KC19_1G224000 [Ceratodon purpureus]|uniref:Uncharacterized protein n=1 Tax=Ceratodon purpureus TaxID=3225 RepID=A0A8T0JB78_CERPU|nr:hypothetical protein KC19_1G224000 [Ceratodon purpureus]